MSVGVCLRNFFPTGPAVKGARSDAKKGSQLKQYINKINLLVPSSSRIFLNNPHIIITFMYSE